MSVRTTEEEAARKLGGTEGTWHEWFTSNRRYLTYSALIGLIFTWDTVDGITQVPDLPDAFVRSSLLAFASAITFTLWQESNDARDHRIQVRRDLETLINSELAQSVGPDEISAQLEVGLQHSESWHFRGGTGTFLRSDTIPTLANRAGRLGSTFTISVEMIDPDIEDACERYATFRRNCHAESTNSTERSWTVRSVQLEACASLLALAWYSQHRMLRCEVALSPLVNAIRFDMSDEFIMLTSAYWQFPALRVNENSPLYNAIREDLRLQLAGGRKAWPTTLSVPTLSDKIDDITRDEIEQLLDALEVEVTKTLSDADLDELKQMAFHRRHPYA